MHEDSMRARVSAVIALLVLVGLGKCVQVSANPALVVYDHGLTKRIIWENRGQILANKTSSFTQDDVSMFAYVRTGHFSSANLTWMWYDPDGQLYSNRTDHQGCEVSRCTFVFFFGIADTQAAIRFGLWRVDLLADGFRLYSDYFKLTPVILEDDYWNFNVVQSAPANVHVNLTVTIHPNNITWSSYRIRIPAAANVTAYDSASNRALSVLNLNNSIIDVDLDGARPDGYRFVLSFDLSYGSRSLGGWDTGNFALSWQESPWDRLIYPHPHPSTFKITLPENATFTDIVGTNAMTLYYSVTNGARPSVTFTRTITDQRFGWTMLYRDFTWRNSFLASHPNTFTATTATLSLPTQQTIPFLHMTLGGLSLLTAIMSVILLTTAELVPPISARTGILINRRRLRIAALVAVGIFMVTIAYQVLLIAWR